MDCLLYLCCRQDRVQYSLCVRALYDAAMCPEVSYEPGERYDPEDAATAVKYDTDVGTNVEKSC
jgi:hypothetical protein